ncbi:elongation factor 1-beta-like protein, partial [Tanacetum coccineum]
MTSHGLTFLLALIGHAGNAPAAELANALKVSKMLQMDRLRSSIVVDVKPWEDETDMQKIEEAIRSVQREGFTWSAYPVTSLTGQHRICRDHLQVGGNERLILSQIFKPYKCILSLLDGTECEAM